jgi:hypothetical protein
MAETSFAKLQTPTALRAEVTKTGPGWGIEASHAVASDPVLHMPLHDPRIPQPAPQPPSPPQPTEQQHRTALAAAIEAQKRADAACGAAADAHARALLLVERRREALAAFVGLDDDRLAATLHSLRDDDGSDSVAIPAADERLIRRETARLDLQDAEAAAETLLHELILMRGEADAAAREVNRLVASVLAHMADAIAGEHADLIAEAEAKLETLHAFDFFSANTGARPSGRVQTLLLGSGHAALARERDTSTWQRARERLLADPEAEIVIEGPTPQPSRATAWPVIVSDTILDTATGERLSMAEASRRMLERRRAAAAPPPPEAA